MCTMEESKRQNEKSVRRLNKMPRKKWTKWLIKWIYCVKENRLNEDVKSREGVRHKV